MKNKQLQLFKALALGLVVFWVDFFCGAGGTSTGIHHANGNTVVIYCINHDEVAIASHLANHPDCIHDTEDVRNPEVVERLSKVVAEYRKNFPGCRINFWVSAECTNLSGAKGGLSRNPDSRTLSESIEMYVDAVNPDYIYCENVREILKWGLTRLKEGAGSTEDFCELAVDPKKGEYVIMPNKQYDTISYRAWRDSLMFRGYKYDYKLLDVADFECYTSRLRYWGIFAKAGLPIVWPEKTANKDGSNGMKKHKAVREVLDLHFKGAPLFSKKRAKKSLARFLLGLKKNAGASHFMTGFYGNGRSHSVDLPCNTLTTKDRYALHYIQYDYSNVCFSGMDAPAGSLTTNPKHTLVSVDYWLMDMSYGRVSHSIEKPCFTIIARQDKKPIYLLAAEYGYPENFISDDDCELTREIKEFMITHRIKNVYMRMLTIKEKLRIQGFPETYILKGTQADQNRFIGNSVPPLMAQRLVEANFYGLNDPKYTHQIYNYENRKSKKRSKTAA